MPKDSRCQINCWRLFKPTIFRPQLSPSHLKRIDTATDPFPASWEPLHQKFVISGNFEELRGHVIDLFEKVRRLKKIIGAKKASRNARCMSLLLYMTNPATGSLIENTY